MVALVQTSTRHSGDGRPGTASTAERSAERRPGTAGSISQSVRSMYSCKSSLVKERFFFLGRFWRIFLGGFLEDLGMLVVLMSWILVD